MPTGQLLHLDRHPPATPSTAPTDTILVPRSAPAHPAPRTLCVYIDARNARQFANLIAPARLAVLPALDRALVLAQHRAAALAPSAPPRDMAIRFPGRFLTTVLMTDVVESTHAVATMGDQRWSELLGDHYDDCRTCVAEAGGDFLDTTGDGILATFDAPTRAVRAGLAIQAAARKHGIGVRVGVHTGECERVAHGVAGIAVHIAARICAL